MVKKTIILDNNLKSGVVQINLSSKKIERVLIHKKMENRLLIFKKATCYPNSINLLIESIQQTIWQLIQSQYSNNGWDKASSSVSSNSTFVSIKEDWKSFYLGNADAWKIFCWPVFKQRDKYFYSSKTSNRLCWHQN